MLPKLLPTLLPTLLVAPPALLTGCTERPSDEMLRPPPQFERAIVLLGERGRATSQQLAVQAERETRRIVRRSGRVTGPVLAQAIRHAEYQAARAGA